MKTMKQYIWAMGVALTAIALTACSSEDELAQTETPVKQDNVVTLTATVLPTLDVDNIYVVAFLVEERIKSLCRAQRYVVLRRVATTDDGNVTFQLFHYFYFFRCFYITLFRHFGYNCATYQ